MSENKKIELEDFFLKQSGLQRDIGEAMQKVNVAQTMLSAFNEDAKTALIESLGLGYSTGDPLRDEVLQIFGLDKEILDKVVAFNDRLIKSRGKEMIAVFPYRQRIRFGGPGDKRESDYANCEGYVFGVLSGERLKLTRSGENRWDDLKAMIPFDRHVVWGFNGNRTTGALRPKIGVVTLCGHSFLNILDEPNAGTFISGIIGGKEADASILIGEEVERGMLKFQFTELKEIRKVLHSATPEEQTAGLDI